MAVATAALLASAGAFASSVKSVESSKRITEAAVFAETILEDISAQGYDVLLALDGNEFFDKTDENDSNYLAEVAVFQSTVSLRQVRLVVSDLRTGEVLGRITLQRSNT